MATVVREIERKYDSPAGTAAALDAVQSMIGVEGVAAVTRQDPEILDAVYYDTADLRLIRARVTLRRRTGGDDAGWHLKLPASAGTRDEIRLPLAVPAGKPVGKPAAGAASGQAGTPAATPRARASGTVPKELSALVRARTRGCGAGPGGAHTDQPRPAPSA